MTSRLGKLTLNGWGGGLSSVNNGQDAQLNQLVRADNVIIDKNGHSRIRFGSEYDGTGFFLSKNVATIDVCRPYQQDSNGRITKFDFTVMKTYAFGGSRGQYLFVDGKYVHSNGKDTMQVWTDLDVTTSDVLGIPPLSRFLYVHNDRCFAGENNVLYETGVDTYPDSAVDNFAIGASWTIGDDSSNIIGVCGIKRNLYIFKADAVHVQTGYTKNERQNSIFDGSRGCLSPDSIKFVTIRGMGDGIIFLDNNAKLCFLTNSGITEIGEAVQDKLDAIHYGAPVYEVTVAPKLHRAHGGVIKGRENYYLLGYTDGSGVTDDWRHCICVHLDLVHNSIYGIRPVMTFFTKPNPVPTLDTQKTTDLSFCCFDAGGRGFKETLGTLSFYTGADRVSYVSDFDLDTIRDKDASYVWRSPQDRIVTATIDLGVPDLKKTWMKLRLWASLKTYEPHLGIMGFMFTQYYDRKVKGTKNDNVRVLIPLANEVSGYKGDVVVNLFDSSGEVSFEMSIYDSANTGYNQKNVVFRSMDIEYKVNSKRNASAITITV